MLLLTCPHCDTAAEETELTPGGEAHLRRAGPGTSDEVFESYMFDRVNAKGAVLERWRHAYGCGKWFLAARDSMTQQVYGTYLPSLLQPPDEICTRIRAVHPDWRMPE